MTKRKSILNEISSTSRGCTWAFPQRALDDIAEVRAAMDAGTHAFGAMAVARALKARYNLPVTAKTIAQRLAEMHGGKW